jgi:hypothetical protein
MFDPLGWFFLGRRLRKQVAGRYGVLTPSGECYWGEDGGGIQLGSGGGNCGRDWAAARRRFAVDVLLGSKIAISQIKLGKSLSWLAIVPHLLCDSLKCASNSLVGADKPP